MKIAVFTDTYFPQVNGVVTCISDSVRVLSRNNSIVLFAPGGKKLRTEKRSKNFRIRWVPAKQFPFYEGYRISSLNYKRVSSLLDKENPDIVHAHAPVLLGLQGIIAAKRRGIPVVATYHTHYPDYVPHLLNGKLPKPFESISEYTVKKLIRHAFGMADAVTAPTRELVSELRSYGVENAAYLPNGVDLKKFTRDPEKGSEFREQFGIRKTDKVVLYLGRISFEKKPDVLLQAFRMIEEPGRVLVIAGKGPYMEEMKRLAHALELERVVFTGYLEDLTAAYSAADIFASASDTETFGLTFIEAMHTGLPVIGVSRLGAKEVIENGKTGILVEPDNVLKLAGAMDGLLKNDKKRRKMALEARKSSEEYSLKKSTRELMKIYRGLAGEVD
ncbi:glycosyltransferase [Candidatus Micrarchaeota archaeon]|nr:glycosyltransferase [Candidatus Micrarchaeota archaeon]